VEARLTGHRATRRLATSGHAPGNYRHQGYKVRIGVVGSEVIDARHRNVALLVAGCLFMDMLDGTKIVIS
jgi:hypothetical protein